MEEKLQEIIEKAVEEKLRLEEKVSALRNKINFCSTHKFEEEVRIANIELSSIDSVIYDYEHFIKDLRIILKSYENGSK